MDFDYERGNKRLGLRMVVCGNMWENVNILNSQFTLCKLYLISFSPEDTVSVLNKDPVVTSSENDAF